jgi:FMN reductase
VNIVGVSGNLGNPSRTSVLVEAVLAAAGQRPGVRTDLVSIAALAPSLGRTVDPKDAPADLASAYETLYAADVLVIGTPVYKASYTGLLKHYFDLIGPKELSGKWAILTATGGSDQHALVLEHQLRPLLSFFGVHTLPTAIYAKDSDFAKFPDGQGYRLDQEEIQERIDAAVQQLWKSLDPNAALAVAA